MAVPVNPVGEAGLVQELEGASSQGFAVRYLVPKADRLASRVLYRWRGWRCTPILSRGC